jgi:hypothetical protein
MKLLYIHLMKCLCSIALCFGAQDDADENEEDNEDYREGKLRFAGGRGEAATYDDGDEDDAQLAAALRRETMQEDDEVISASFDLGEQNIVHYLCVFWCVRLCEKEREGGERETCT